MVVRDRISQRGNPNGKMMPGNIKNQPSKKPEFKPKPFSDHYLGLKPEF